jgi:hypothetical protein
MLGTEPLLGQAQCISRRSHPPSQREGCKKEKAPIGLVYSTANTALGGGEGEKNRVTDKYVPYFVLTFVCLLVQEKVSQRGSHTSRLINKFARLCGAASYSGHCKEHGLLGCNVVLFRENLILRRIYCLRPQGKRVTE